MPVKPFANLLAARRWVTDLAHWYNNEHSQSAIGFVTPAQRHAGLDSALLEHCVLVYERARPQHPERWSRHSRQWAYVDTVHLNPETPIIKELEHPKSSLTHFTQATTSLTAADATPEAYTTVPVTFAGMAVTFDRNTQIAIDNC